MSNSQEGSWVAWQSMGPAGPGRWSFQHYTTESSKALCGRKIPQKHRVFRFEVLPDIEFCRKCQQKLDTSPTCYADVVMKQKNGVVSVTKSTLDLCVILDGVHFTFVQNDNGCSAYREGRYCRNLTGDMLVMALMQEVIALRQQKAELLAACEAVRSQGSQGTLDDDISVSYLIEEAIRKSKE